MDNKLIKQDRLRFTKNTASANLAYLAILFNVLYFVSIYSTDPGNYYYSIDIGISVVYNLLFLLITFLSSEGLKNYKLSYAVVISVIGIMQIVRIFGIPMDASHSFITDTTTPVMEPDQFKYVTTMLVLSAICCIASGVNGIIRSLTLREYNRKLAAGEIHLEFK